MTLRFSEVVKDHANYMIITNIKHIIILMGVRFASIGSNDLDLIHEERLESI